MSTFDEQTATIVMNDGKSLFVLIVGIDNWINPILRPLTGAVNDAKLMTSVFRERFAVPDENIVTLLDNAATRDAITTAFRSHLIERAAALSTSDEPASFVFCYAGHGSRSRDTSGTQPDGLDETIVPHDSRTEDVFDIKDWELAAWLDELTRYTQNVTVILDCCHSGSGTRDDDTEGVDRLCPPDLREQPEARPLSSSSAETRSTIPMTTAAQEKYTLLAACRSDEFAREYVVRDESGRRKHGAYTYFLAEELMQLPPGRTPACSEIHERVRFRVHRKYRSQMPQCEGDRDRLLFGGVNAVRDPLMTVQDVKKRDGSVWVDAGRAHGLAKGARLRVYPPETRTVDHSTEILGTLTVADAQAVRSRCVADDGLVVQRFSRVALQQRGTAQHRRLVSLDLSDENLQTMLAEELSTRDLSPYVQVTTDTDSSAEFVIALNEDEDLTIHDAAGNLIVSPTPQNEPEQVASDVAALCRYYNVLDLRNHSRTSDLAGKINVRFHEVLDDPDDPDGSDAPQTARSVRRVAPIAETADGLPIIEMGVPIAIEIRNDSSLSLFCEAISFGYDYAVVPLTELVAKGTRKRVEPGGTIWFGRDASDKRIQFSPPDDDRFTEAREFLKVIATEEEANYDILRQNGLRVPVVQTRSAGDSELEALFAHAMTGTRALGVEDTQKDEQDWTTVDLEYRVTRPAERKRHRVGEGKRLALPDYDLAVETPPGMDCVVSVLNTTETARSAAANTSAQPSGPLWESDDLVLVTLGSQRATAPSGAAIAIETDATAAGKLSVDNPLTLHLSETAADPALAVAWDGEFAYPVGTETSPGRINVSWLPECGAIDETDMVDDTGTRSVLRSAKLYIYRARGRETDELGLHFAHFVGSSDVASDPADAGERVVHVGDGEVRYRPVPKASVTSEQRVIVLLNGFPCGSESLVADLAPLLESYDHILTFDFEGYGTPIGQNGVALHRALTAAGFSKEDDVRCDVIAHGSGAIVARAMIELEGGREFVNRCICIGAPNQGTSLMSMKEATSWIAMALMNSMWRGSFVGSFMGFMLRQLVRDGKGFNDLATNSQFLNRLNNNGRRGRVRYHLIAGEFTLAADSDDRMARLWNRVCSSGLSTLSKIFGESHDLIVNTPGMTKLSTDPGQPGAKSTSRVQCHHFDYFSHDATRQELKRLLNTDKPA